MKYHAVNGKHVRVVDLRETAKYLIDDSGVYGKFKKVEGKSFIASNFKFQNWSHSGYDIYPLNHEYPLRLIKEYKEEMYIYKVQEEIKNKFKKLKSFDQALSLNDLLGLGVEHPNK